MMEVPPPAPVIADAAVQGEFTWREIDTASGPRRFKVYLPAKYDKSRPAPLIVVLHGCTQDPEDVARGTQFNRLADEKGMVVVYPEQNVKANGLKCWNWFDSAQQRRDQGEPALIAQIAQRVMNDHSIDSRRVYIAGLSAGGAMALTVAYAYPEVFAAAAIHSGIAFGSATSIANALKAMGGAGADVATLPSAVTTAMGSRRHFPAIVFQGAADKSVNVVNAGQIVSQLSEMYSPGGLKKLSEKKGKTTGGYHFTTTTYGRNKPVIEKWVVDELGHAWSGGSKDGTYTDPSGPDAGREIVRFFLEHPRN